MKCRATPTVNSEFDRSKRCIFTSFLCVPNPYTFDHFVSFRDLRCSVAQHLATIELYTFTNYSFDVGVWSVAALKHYIYVNVDRSGLPILGARDSLRCLFNLDGPTFPTLSRD